MKRMKPFLLILALPLILTFQGTGPVLGKSRHQKLVEKQHREDLKRKEAILKKMKTFIREVNQAVEKESGIRIKEPIEVGAITDITDTDHVHTPEDIPPRVFAYINQDMVPLRIEDNTGSKILGRFKLGAKVEVIVRSDGSAGANTWYLVRTSTGIEGWLEGKYLQKEKVSPGKPRKKEPEPVKPDKGKTQEFMVPLIGKKTSNFGYRIDPITRKRKSFHKGIDIAAPTGTPVKACAEGTVRKADYNRSGYGNLIVLEHASNFASYYGHLSKMLVRPGAKVRQGDVIGKVGSTGRSTGPHLHFEIRRGDTALNPDAYLR